MTIATIQMASDALQRDVMYNAIIPEGPGPYPILLQLHGYSDNYTTWLTHTRIAIYASVHPMIVIMPEGSTAFYLNIYNKDKPAFPYPLKGQMYEDFLIHDLWQHVTNTYHVRPGRWAIGGNSMGGYGAMRLGCKYPDRFASIWAHSGGFYPPQAMEGFCPDPADADVYAITARLAQTSHTTQITFDCGTEDHLFEYNRNMDAHMDKVGLTHQYIQNEGKHDWEYWDKHLPAALAQHARIFAQEASKARYVSSYSMVEKT